MTTPNDDLLARLRRGEDTARRELFSLCQTRLRPYFHSRLPNPADLDDCVSEVLARALEGIHRGNQPNVLDAWLVGIARNVLKERYEARRRDGGELPAELPPAPAEPHVELADTADLPEAPTELEMLIGKRELWATLDGAIDGISAGLQPIMREHVRQSREKQCLVVGADLATALDMPVTGLNRQLERARKATLNSIAALVVARTGRRHCPDLDAMLGAGPRGIVLDPAQSTRVLKHAGGCPVCGPRARDAREYSKWALGPGLIGLAQDDDERRRAVLALLSRGGEVPTSAGPAAVLMPVQLATKDAPGLAERVRTAVATRMASLPGVDSAVQFAQQNPDLVQRVAAVTVGGVALAATIMIGLLGDQPGDSNTAEAEGRPPVVTTTTTTPPAQSPVAAPATTTTSASSVTQKPTPTGPGTRPRPTATPAVETEPTPAVETPPNPTTTPANPEQTTTPPTDEPPPTTTTTTTTAQPPQARDVSIDATGADYVQFGISGAGAWRDARTVQSYPLSPGTHVLLTQMGYQVVFTVTDSWTVDYDHRYDRLVSGRGTSTLAVHGMPVKVDASDADYTDTAVSGTGWRNAGPVKTLQLLPGPHYVQSSSGSVVHFQVTEDGLVEFDHAVDRLATGRGTSTLAIHGLPVTFDTSDTDYTNTAISGTGWRNAGPVRTLRLLPGPHYVQAPTGAVVRFQVTDAGLVETTDHLATSQGTTLTIHGLPITIDTSDTDYTNTAISGTGWRNAGPVRTLRLLPGPHYVQAPTGAVVRFQVTDTGQVETTDHLATSQGTTLTIHGLPVTIDRSDVDYTYLAISGIGVRFDRPAYTLRLLPGPHHVQTPQLNTVRFQVTADGRIEFDASYDRWAGGRGTSTLTVHGVAITIDATATTHTSIQVSGVAGWKNPRQEQTVRLMPGKHQVVALDGRKYEFVVKDNGLLDYDPSLDAVLSGRNSTRLTIS
jgi:DNA-directed RNA polymerase specialized sigma24 family protein